MKRLSGLMIGALALALSAVPLAVAAAQVDRVGGADRYETAANLANRFWPQAETVFIATGQNFADAMVVGPVAKAADSPILLVSDRMPLSTLGELRRLHPKEVYIIGGRGVVAESIKDTIEKELPQTTVLRLGGVDRFETSALVYGLGQELARTNRAQVITPTSVYLADGGSFEAQLNAAGVAARDAGLMLLLPTQSPDAPAALPAPVAEALNNFQVSHVRVVAGGFEGSWSRNTLAQALIRAKVVNAGQAASCTDAEKYFAQGAFFEPDCARVKMIHAHLGLEREQLAMSSYPQPPARIYVTRETFPDALAAIPLLSRYSSAPPALLTTYQSCDLSLLWVADNWRNLLQEPALIVGGVGAIGEGIAGRFACS